MKRKNIIGLMLSAAVGMMVFGFNWFSPISAQTNEEKAVMDVMQKEAAAVEKGDLAALDNLWANDESVTVFESGHANYGWKDYRDSHLGPELQAFKNTKYAFSDMKIKVSGAMALATFKYTLSADFKERKIDSGGLGTAVLEKRRGKWVIVHWHSSAPPRRPSPSPTPKSS
ncbi:MAG TPA: nuclear transport factor 2 family protein [Pyrinomonadaceae bacterium]|nr:nuclear transport factor 2 family protein [Pyrinomonadaceae bacterium]